MSLPEYVNGSDFGIFVGDTLISVGLDNQLQLTKNMIETSNKDSGKSAEYIPGRGDGTVSGSSRVKYAPGYGFSDLLAIYNDDTKVTIKYMSREEVADTKYYEMEAYISELSRQDPDDDASSIDYTFQKTGDIEEKTVAAAG